MDKLSQVKSYTSASPISVEAVTEWLSEHGITDVRLESTVHDYITFTAPIYTANDLFDTEFHSYLHVPSGKRAIRTLRYSIPVDLRSHISIVHPAASFDLAKPLGISVSHASTRGQIDPSCANTITPQCLQDLYDIPTTPATQPSNRIAVPGFIDYWAQVMYQHSSSPWKEL